MDKHVLHNIIHQDKGNNSEACPVCNGEMKMSDTKGMEDMCNTILKRKQSYGYMYSEGKGIKPKNINNKSRIFTEFQFAELTPDGKLPEEIMLVPIGKWNTQKYGEVEITKDDVEMMAKNFNDKVRKGVMIDIDHGQSQYGDAAGGWIKAVEVRDNGLWGVKLEWSTLGTDLVKGNVYKFLSPEFDTVYVSPDNKDEILENVLIATSLVNRPALHDIPELSSAYAFSEKDTENKNLTKGITNVMIFTEKPMNIDQILAKKKEERTSEEVAYLEANKQTFSEEQKTKYAAETPAPIKDNPSVDPKGNPEKKEFTENKTVSFTESEARQMREDAEKGRLAFKEMEKSQIRNEYNTFLFSETGGQLPPAVMEKDLLVDFVASLNADQRLKFSEIVKALPDRKMFGEIGKAKDTTSNMEADQVTAEVTQYAKDNKVTFSEALDAMQKSEPEKFAAYRNNFK